MDLTQLKVLTLPLALLTLVGCATASKTPESVNPAAREVVSVIGNAAPGQQVSLPKNNELRSDSVIVDSPSVAASGRECRRMRTVQGVPMRRVVCKSGDGVWSLARDLNPNSQRSSMGLGTSTALRTTQAIVPTTTNTLTSNNTNASDLNANELTANASNELLPNATDVELSSAESVVINDVIIDDVAAAMPMDELPTIETVKRTLNANETLWKFSKRTTGNALNWETIAEINGITNAKTLAPGTQLLIPAELVRQGG